MFGWLDIFSIVGEIIDPGSVGTIEAAAPEIQSRPRTTIIVHFTFALGLFLAIVVGLCLWNWGHWGWLAFWLIILAIYLFAAHYLTPTPDYDNMGWCGGWLDNMFRFSDDLNWYLWILKIVLMPGAFLTVGMRDGFLLMTGQIPRKKRKKKKRLKLQESDNY